FFGDEVESLRVFDPATQRSTGELDVLQLAPATELALWRGEAGVAALRELDWSTLRQEVREEWDWQARDLAAGLYFAEAPFYAAYLQERPGSLLEYLDDPLVVLDEPAALRAVLHDLEDQRQELAEK